MRFSIHRFGSTVAKFAGGPIERPLAYYSQFRPASLTMQQYLDFGRRGSAFTSYHFLKTELLVRMANIMQEFDLLPTKLLHTPSARHIGSWYKQSFSELLQFEGLEPSDTVLEKFNNQLRTILHRHNTVVETMAEALIELKESRGVDIACERNIQYFLDRFYLNRISIRMLQNQHLAIFAATCDSDGSSISGNQSRSTTAAAAAAAAAATVDPAGHVGYIDPQCNVRDILLDAYENARFLSEQHFCVSPLLDVHCFNARMPNEQIRVPLVPLHLYYIVFELLKNSMRATVEHHHRVKGTDADSSEDLAEVRACIVLGAENLSIKISDRGGGVSSAKLSNLFNYLYSTAPRPSRDEFTTPFAGYGYGLPISRLYARYFLGDLSLTSMDGYGTDAVISLKAVPSQACELLPVFGASSRRFITMAREAPDYCFQKPTPIASALDPIDNNLETAMSSAKIAAAVAAVKPTLTATMPTKSNTNAERVAI